MDVLAKNMIWTSSDPLLNYGSLDKSIYTLVGNVSSVSPFTISILADGIVVPFKQDIFEGDLYTISFSGIYSTYLLLEQTENIKLEFNTTDVKNINLKLWKSYPITEPVLENSQQLNL